MVKRHELQININTTTNTCITIGLQMSSSLAYTLSEEAKNYDYVVLESCYVCSHVCPDTSDATMVAIQRRSK